MSINAAFRSSRKNEAYIFIGQHYVLVNYAPGSKGDRALYGGLKAIASGFPSLRGTPFQYRIDCAFGSSSGTNEAYIFCKNICALIDYAPHSKNDWIIRGPVTIAAMFPFLKGTVFESGIDAAFESTNKYQAYLFKGKHSARINYNGSGSINSYHITEQFPCLKGTIFEDGVGAAFASHRYNQAYLFKRGYYALINFAPGTMNDYIIRGVKNIKSNWPSLRDITCDSDPDDNKHCTRPEVFGF